MNLLNEKGYIPFKIFQTLESRIKDSKRKNNSILSLIADLIRYNTLLSVARAGTGHLGASLSIIENLTEIYFRSFEFCPQYLKSKDRDVIILSKGHAVPSLYAVMSAKGYFPVEKLDKLRRLNGLPGHSDVSTRGIEANTGSLAMGLSKAVGIALSKKRFGNSGSVIVIAGDGEMQEGQCWEAFLSAVSFKLDNLYILIDDNRVQTDQYTEKIVRYGRIIDALRNLGLFVFESDGTNMESINIAFKKAKKMKGKPKILYLHTLKGQGISFMEHSSVLKKESDRYIWHNRAPNINQLEEALNEILDRNRKLLNDLKLTADIKNSLMNIPIMPIQENIKGENLIEGFSKALVSQARKNKKIVVFDCDLEEDCGFIPFHKKFPERFFEMGIMEQHTVSAASSFSRSGFTPVLSTYAAFLTSRANEQLYNLASEDSRALFVGVMSGIIPSTPGKSHQGFRDIACIKNIPGTLIYQPITSQDISNVLDKYFHNNLGKRLYLRLSMASSKVKLETPEASLSIGESQVLRKGSDLLIISAGPVILGEVLNASNQLQKEGIDIEVWNNPWFVKFNTEQLKEAAIRKIPLLIFEDHTISAGMGESLLSFLSKNKIEFKSINHCGLQTFPETGFRDEILKKFGLDSRSIIREVKKILKIK